MSTMDDEKKVEDLTVHPSCLQGLTLLQQSALLVPDGDVVDSCNAWPSDRVNFDADGRVTFLNLGGKRLHKGLDCVEAFSYFSRLSSLSLSGTDIPLADAEQVLTHVAPTLESLFLGSNSTWVADLLGKWMGTAPILNKLDLRYNELDSSNGLASLCRGLEDHPSLKYLYLEGNKLDELECLAAVLSQDTCAIQELYLGANRVNAKGASQLASCLESNAVLTKIYLEGNAIGPEGAQAFTTALEKMQGKAALKHLFVDNNNIGKEGSERLAKALNSGTTIG
jgi:Leucine-rich repeat (LRR) protein